MKIFFTWMATLFLFLLTTPAAPASPGPAEPRRGLFITVLQDPQVLSSREAIDKLIGFAKKARIQTLFFQIYRANKAWFPSKIGDSKPYEDCLKEVGEDPFALLIRRAHDEGIEVHAWLNLLSLSKNLDAPLLKKYGPDILTRNRREKKKIEDYKIDNQYFLEPGDPRIRQDLTALVGEILTAYPALDGIQFDYIRYPDQHPPYGYTEANLSRFKEATGLTEVEEDSPSWKKWKRDQVTSLLELLAQTSRKLHPGIQVSATGCMSYSRAYHEAFQDWASWLTSGIVDFVTMMSYSSHTSTLGKYILDAKKHTGSLERVNIGIGAYELVRRPETFLQQLEVCEKAQGRACAVFHYESTLDNPRLADALIRKRS
ncbi:MAG: family 10 glycosylhydrolase [Candidatus Omnitrophota bacterium]|jgi:uncharacterized lipoprotein YddW (UPF0748 family)